MKKTTVYGYARVSAKDQNLARQVNALTEFPVEPHRIYTDKASGKDFNRPKYRTLLRRLRPNDVLVIESIDRLGRNYNEILEQWRIITKEKEVYIVVLDMPLLDTRRTESDITGVFIADAMLQLLSYVAQIEREHIRQRQAEGIAAARKRGVSFGRPPLPRPATFHAARDQYLDGRITRDSMAEMFGVSTRTIDRWLAQELKDEEKEET